MWEICVPFVFAINSFVLYFDVISLTIFLFIVMRKTECAFKGWCTVSGCTSVSYRLNGF